MTFTFFHTSGHCPILFFSCDMPFLYCPPKLNILCLIPLYLLFLLSNPLCPMFSSSPPVFQSPCSSRILQDVLPTSPNPFISWYSYSCPSPTHLFSLPRCLLLIFFLSLHIRSFCSDSHFTVIYGNPSLVVLSTPVLLRISPLLSSPPQFV